MKTVALRVKYRTVYIAVTCTNTTPRGDGDTSILTMQLTNTFKLTNTFQLTDTFLNYGTWMVVAMITTTGGI